MAADDQIPNTSPGYADYGYVGSHRKLYEHQGLIATIEMGVRQYVPTLGRFLSVEGGVSNTIAVPATSGCSSDNTSVPYSGPYLGGVTSVPACVEAKKRGYFD